MVTFQCSKYSLGGSLGKTIFGEKCHFREVKRLRVERKVQSKVPCDKIAGEKKSAKLDSQIMAGRYCLLA